MENTLSKAYRKKDGQVEDDLFIICKDLKLARDNTLGFPESKFKKLVRRAKFYHALVVSTKKLQIQSSQGPRSLTSSIPKHLVSLDERYLWHCQKLIHITVSKAASCNISVSLGQSRMGISFEDSILTNYGGSCDLDSFVVECPLPAGAGNVEISPPGQWIIGSVTQSKSMMNILRSPLFRQYGILDNNPSSKSLFDVEGAVCSAGIPGPLPRHQNEITLWGDCRHGSEKGHERFFSISSTNSSCSDQSSTSSTFSGLTTISQGMLQCTWKCGFPHYVFSTDNQGEVYLANLSKLDSSDDNAVDYAYLFHLGVNGQLEHTATNNESLLVGKMKVSSSFTFCPNNSRIVETEFVLFAPPENHAGEGQTSGHRHTKSSGFTKRVAKAFWSGRASHKRSTSKFAGTSSVPENCSWEPCSDVCNDNINNEQSPNVDLLDNDLPPNLESIAVVARHHLHNSNQKVESGGWGLKFLKKNRMKKASACPEAPLDSECCMQSTGGCSMSIDILVPAGLHGGPKTCDGGPSSLIQRWRSGGVCDCGGWDTGCALTVLNTRSKKEVELDASDKCRSFNVFTQGSEQSVPTLRMLKLHDGLHIVHFQSSLSALQSFSIAVAIKHMQCPTLRPKNMQ